jgi:hypothetical protein
MFFRRAGACVAHFDARESNLLQQLFTEVLTLLSEGFDRTDPVISRLFPDLYRDDPVGSAELREFTDPDLKTAKLEQAGEVLATLPQEAGLVRLDDEQAATWLRALTDVRIAIGLRLDVADDTDIQQEIDEAVLVNPTSSRVELLSVYAYLGYLQESLLDALVG